MLPGSRAPKPTPGPLNTCPLNMTVAQLSLLFFKTKTMFPGMTWSSSGVSGTNPNSTRWASPSRALQGDAGGRRRGDRHKIQDPNHCLAWTASYPLALWTSNYGHGAGSLQVPSNSTSNCPGDPEQGGCLPEVPRGLGRKLHVNVLRNHTCKWHKRNITTLITRPWHPCPPFPSEEEVSWVCLAGAEAWVEPNQRRGTR